MYPLEIVSLQGWLIKMKFYHSRVDPSFSVSVCLVSQPCPTLCNPIDCSHQPVCPWGFSSKVYWSGLPRPPPGDLPNLGIEHRSPALRRILYHLSHQGICKKRGNLDTDRNAGECHFKMKLEIMVMFQQAKEHQRSPANHQKEGKGYRTDSVAN